MRLRKALLLIVVWVGLPMVSCVARAQQTAKPALEFEVALGAGEPEHTFGPTKCENLLDTEDAFAPTGGLFAAKGFTLGNYIAFAYRQQNSPALRTNCPSGADDQVRH